MTGVRPARFKQAVDQARSLIAEGLDGPFEIAIDVRRARATKSDRSISAGPPDRAGARRRRRAISARSPRLRRGHHAAATGPRAEPRTGWKLEAHLLDLSLKNRLLNFKDAKTAIHMPRPGGLEDLLSSRQALQAPAQAIGRRRRRARRGAARDRSRTTHTAFHPRGDETGRPSYERDRGPARWPADRSLSGRPHCVRGRRRQHPVSVAGLPAVDAAGRRSPYRAPLILIPVQLERKSVRSGFRLCCTRTRPASIRP